MHKRTITYEDMDGVEQTEIFWFNISKREILKLNAEHQGGFVRWIQNLIDAKDDKTVLEEFEKILLMSFGVREDDGKRFNKSDELRNWFRTHLAYESLFDELTENETSISNFILGIVPKQAQDDVRKAITEAKPPEGNPSEASPATT